MTKHIPDWAWEIYIHNKSVKNAIHVDMVYESREELHSVISQLVAEYLMKRNWRIE